MSFVEKDFFSGFIAIKHLFSKVRATTPSDARIQAYILPYLTLAAFVVGFLILHIVQTTYHLIVFLGKAAVVVPRDLAKETYKDVVAAWAKAKAEVDYDALEAKVKSPISSSGLPSYNDMAQRLWDASWEYNPRGPAFFDVQTEADAPTTPPLTYTPFSLSFATNPRRSATYGYPITPKGSATPTKAFGSGGQGSKGSLDALREEAEYEFTEIKGKGKVSRRAGIPKFYV